MKTSKIWKEIPTEVHWTPTRISGISLCCGLLEVLSRGKWQNNIKLPAKETDKKKTTVPYQCCAAVFLRYVLIITSMNGLATLGEIFSAGDGSWESTTNSSAFTLNPESSIGEWTSNNSWIVCLVRRRKKRKVKYIQLSGPLCFFIWLWTRPRFKWLYKLWTD